jgi:hypothetical protein
MLRGLLTVRRALTRGFASAPGESGEARLARVLQEKFAPKSLVVEDVSGMSFGVIPTIMLC